MSSTRRTSPKFDILVVEHLLELVDCFVATLPDRLIHLHLQHEVAAALEIESQLDAVGKFCFTCPREVGTGMPIKPKMHTRMTTTIKMNFHLSCEPM